MDATMHSAWSWVRAEIGIGVVCLLLLIVPKLLILRCGHRRRYGWGSVARAFDTSADAITEDKTKYCALLEWTFWPLLFLGVGALWIGIPAMHTMQAIDKGDMLCFGSRFPQAGVWYQNALKIDPESSLAHHGLGNVLLEEGRKAEALHEYEAAIRFDPENAIYHRDLAVLWTKYGSQERAYEEYLRASSLDPQASEIHVEFARLLVGKGKLEDAEKQYRVAMQYSHDPRELHLDLANTLVRQGRSDEAMEEYVRFLNLHPENAIAQNNYGVLLYSLHRFPMAATAFRKASRLDTHYPDAFYNLGRALQTLGQTEEAIKAYRAFLPLGARSPDYGPSIVEVNRQLRLLEAKASPRADSP